MDPTWVSYLGMHIFHQVIHERENNGRLQFTTKWFDGTS